MITATQLYKTFHTPSGGEVRALDGVNLNVAQGEIFGVVGQSGAGKSTLIRVINQLETLDSGQVSVAGTEMTGLSDKALRHARRNIGMVFQHFNLVNNRSVLQNVEIALEIVGKRGSEVRSRALEILDLVGLGTKVHNYPAQLSGGQKQRVGIARALANNPAVLLSDEATSALDPQTTESILQLLRQLNKALGLTILLITHEMEVVRTICDSAALMTSGRIVESGRVLDLLRDPQSQLVDQIFPVSGAPLPSNGTVIDITFADTSSEDPVISQLVRKHNIDVSIIAASLQEIAGVQAGRTRLQLIGESHAHERAVADLQSQGLIVNVLRKDGQ